MRRLLLLAVLPLLPLLLVAPAGAGGPTSVLVTDPSTGRAAAFTYSHDAYAELDRVLATGERLPGQPSGVGAAVTLTWLIHDVQPWKIQRVYLAAEGGPVVATSGTDATGDAGVVTWTRTSEGKVLQQLVEGALDGSAATGRAASPPAAAPTAPAVIERVVTETAWWSLSGWRWAVPGAILGLMLGAAGALLTARGHLRDREPRQVPVDVSS